MYFTKCNARYLMYFTRCKTRFLMQFTKCKTRWWLFWISNCLLMALQTLFHNKSACCMAVHLGLSMVIQITDQERLQGISIHFSYLLINVFTNLPRPVPQPLIVSLHCFMVPFLGEANSIVLFHISYRCRMIQ